MKVVKFGGSSLASAGQLEKVLNIVKSDPERRFVVVSAPGKRNAEDTKVTDALIKYYRNYVAGNDISKSQSWIIDRYAAMVSELGLKPAVLEKISKSIRALATLPIEENEFLYDTFLAAGENNNAKLIAAYFNQNGIDARYVHPREAGIVVTSEPGHARIIPSSYDKIEPMKSLSFLVSLVLLRKIKSVLSHVEVLISLVLSLLQVSKLTFMKTLQMLMVSLQPTLVLSTNHTLSLS